MIQAVLEQFLIVRASSLACIALLAAALHGQAPNDAAFSIQEQSGTAWLVKPNRQRFFSLGVCVVNQGASRQDYNPTNPGYAAFQHYATSNLWAEVVLKRLKAWHFTTIGGWSDYAALKSQREADVAFIPVLAVGITCGVLWFDMWDTNIIARMHHAARDQILSLRDDPRVLGYYSDNEMGWWNASLLKLTLEQWLCLPHGASAVRPRDEKINSRNPFYHNPSEAKAGTLNTEEH